MQRLVALIAFFAVLGVSIFSGVVSQPLSAQAADLSKFEAGRIIDDNVFFNGTAMNASQIQGFLDQKVPTCTINNGQPSHAAGAPWGSTTIAQTCLKNYSQNTPSMAAQPGFCSAYQGGTNESASVIIAKISVACNISPKVLLVLLEKEQSLISDSWPTVRQINQATGFACYDNGQPCVQTYSGFFYQVWSAARQLQRYGTGTFTWYPVGQVSNVLYQANRPDCGTKSVLIQNRATAALYYYTPYTPNDAALRAGYGIGDECSAYGNRNFFQLFVDWFGTTRAELPQGNLDSASIRVISGQPTLTVSGWSFDPADSSISNSVHVYVTNPSGTQSINGATANLQRGDVNSVFGINGNHGFSTNIPITQQGNYKICVYGIGATSFSAGNRLLRCSNANYSSPQLQGNVDSTTIEIVAGQPTLKLSGWTFDPTDPTFSNVVHVYLKDPSGVQTITGVNTTIPRSDVNTIFGISGLHGFAKSIPVTLRGNYEVCVYAITATSYSAGNRQLKCSTVSFSPQEMKGNVDTSEIRILSGKPTLIVNGWSFDPVSPSISNSNQIVITDPSGVQTTTTLETSEIRGDVNAVFGITGNHGFSKNIPVTQQGTYKVCVQAQGTTAYSGANRPLSCKNVIYTAPQLQGNVDSITMEVVAGQATLNISGWSYDPVDSTISNVLHLYVKDPLGVQTISGVNTTLMRADVNAAFAITGVHGFATSVPVTQRGNYEVCVYAIAATAYSSNNRQLRCSRVSY